MLSGILEYSLVRQKDIIYLDIKTVNLSSIQKRSHSESKWDVITIKQSGFLCIYSSPLVSILQRTQKKTSFQAINTTDTTCHNKKN